MPVEFTHESEHVSDDSIAKSYKNKSAEAGTPRKSSRFQEIFQNYRHTYSSQQRSVSVRREDTNSTPS